MELFIGPRGVGGVQGQGELRHTQDTHSWTGGPQWRLREENEETNGCPAHPCSAAPPQGPRDAPSWCRRLPGRWEYFPLQPRHTRCPGCWPCHGMGRHQHLLIPHQDLVQWRVHGQRVEDEDVGASLVPNVWPRLWKRRWNTMGGSEVLGATLVVRGHRESHASSAAAHTGAAAGPPRGP